MILTKGKPATEAVERNKENLSSEHLWWLLNESTKQYVVAYYSQRNNALQEVSLVQCCQLWGPNPDAVGDDETGERDLKQEVFALSLGHKVMLPIVAPKFADFVRRRRRILTEVRNMRKIRNHVNVIRLEQVLELTQESKCTIFLVMELASGGELFDRIKIDCGTREETARIFFRQLLLGVRHCHSQGVCHRDLKPENLLLSDAPDQTAVLKVSSSARVLHFHLIPCRLRTSASQHDL
jgi:serine/threonine protein kinase